MNSEEYKTYEEMCHKFYAKCRKIVSLCFKDKVPPEKVLHFVINGDNIIGLFDDPLDELTFPKRLMLIDDEKELLEEITNLRKKFNIE